MKGVFNVKGASLFVCIRVWRFQMRLKFVFHNTSGACFRMFACYDGKVGD